MPRPKRYCKISLPSCVADVDSSSLMLCRRWQPPPEPQTQTSLPSSSCWEGWEVEKVEMRCQPCREFYCDHLYFSLPRPQPQQARAGLLFKTIKISWIVRMQACLLSEFLESNWVTWLRRAEFFGQMLDFFPNNLESFLSNVFFLLFLIWKSAIFAQKPRNLVMKLS